MSPPAQPADPHLDDDMLNAWLDRELDADARARTATHLSTCASCAERLSALQTLHVRLQALPDARLERDLSAGVLARLRSNQRAAQAPEPLSRGWRFVTALQMLAVALALAWFAPMVIEIGLPTLRRAQAVIDFGAIGASIVNVLDAAQAIRVPMPIALPEINATHLWTVAIGLWAIVNAVTLLGRRSSVAQAQGE